MGDTMMATSRGVCGEEVELDMRRHIQACACTCNHMGYGNYMDYQVGQDDVASIPPIISSPKENSELRLN